MDGKRLTAFVTTSGIGVAAYRDAPGLMVAAPGFCSIQ